MPKKLLTAAQVAQRFGEDRTTVLQRVRDGKLPFAQRLPGRTGAYLFDAAVVDRIASEMAAELEARLANLQPVPADAVPSDATAR